MTGPLEKPGENPRAPRYKVVASRGEYAPEESRSDPA
jgi:hypothetical protein